MFSTSIMFILSSFAIIAIFFISWALYYDDEFVATVTSPKAGTIIVSGARGSGRNIALKLGDAGFHVIVGVESSAEAKSFRYSSSKGMQSY